MRKFISIFLIPALLLCISKYNVYIYDVENATYKNGIIYVEPYKHFEIDFAVSNCENCKIICYCYLYNSTKHPLQGQVCGSDCIVKGGFCNSSLWYSDFIGNMTFKCFLTKNNEKLKEIKVKVVSR